jgi:pyruvate-formate lyase-activating enzyme
LICLVEPISRNIDVYVPAYPLPLLEVGSFVKSRLPKIDLSIISMAVDYGLPLTPKGKSQIYRQLLRDLSEMKPKGVGISCTAISQAEEVIELCELIKKHDPTICTFLGGYFPTLYYEEIFARTSAVDFIVLGEGEETALAVISLLEEGKKPLAEDIPNLAYKEDGHVKVNRQRKRFDLREKALLDLGLLKYPRSYDVLPYSFSRGCGFRCKFCMEEFIRPQRREVPREIVEADLRNLSQQSNCDRLLVSDALFLSFDYIPMFRELGVKVNFETRADVCDPQIIPHLADVCSMMAVGLESASYDSLKRMNKVKDHGHYQRYISNALAVYKEAVKAEIPIMVFMIAGFPGDEEEDLKKTLEFARQMAEQNGPGGHIFKIGECRVYPRTKLYEYAKSLPDVVFDDDGVFGENVVRQSSKNLDFGTILRYMSEIFALSKPTKKFNEILMTMTPFFRLPVKALHDTIIPASCFMGSSRDVLLVRGENLSCLRKLIPRLREKYKDLAAAERRTRALQL